MSDYEITFARPARKELEALDASVVGRILPRIEALARNPRPAGCRKVHGEPGLWRIRIGNWRVIYRVDDQKRLVDVAGVRHRSDAYR
jgi:mRNA interferase RelE/StbE